MAATILAPTAVCNMDAKITRRLKYAIRSHSGGRYPELDFFTGPPRVRSPILGACEI